jgi:hypothetical protein
LILMPKAQTSMEFLATYGWAILIIIVVLAALYALGVFNTSGFVSRAQPGACQVYRPYGPGTDQLVNLQGVCGTNIPQSVGVFNGHSSVVMIPNSGYLGLTNQLTITAWIYANSSSASTQDVVSKATTGVNSGYTLGTTGGWSSETLSLDIGGSWHTVTATYPGLNGWHFIAATYNGVAMNLYVDGALAGTSAATGSVVVNNNNLSIGNGPGSSAFSGKISNVQVYNASLNSNEIYSTYIKGIGGPPVDLQNIVGWWPLNGDINDYSGNQNNGVANNLILSTGWTSGYTQP